MVTRWGMSDRLGMVQLAPRQSPYLQNLDGARAPRAYSEATANAVDEEVRRIIEESHEMARRLLTDHRASLDALAAALLDRESLDEQEILEVTGLRSAPQLQRGKLPQPSVEGDGQHA